MEIKSTLRKFSKLLFFVFVLAVGQFRITYAQTSGMAVSPAGAQPDASAGFDVNYPDKGLLVPRVALLASTLPNPVVNPALSLLVYNTANSGDVTPGFYFWDGSAWVRLLTGGSSSGTTINCSTSNQYYTVRGDGSGGWECTNALQVSGNSSSGSVGINTSPSSFYDLRVNGNVGIGFSPSSSYGLSVDGTAHVTDYMGIGTSPSSSYGLRVYNNVGIGSSPSSSYDLSVYGDAHISSTLRVGTTSSPASNGILAYGDIQTNNHFVLNSSSSGSGTAVVRTSSGYLMPQSSTIKVKDNVKDLRIDKDNFLKIRPVSFNLKKAFGGDPDIGVIAEEVEKLVPDLVIYGPKRTWIGTDGETLKDKDGAEVVSKTEVEPYSVRYDKLGVYLIKIVSDQDKEIELLKKKIALQERVLSKLAEKNPDLKALLETNEASVSTIK